MVAKDGELKEFTIAGADHIFIPARATIKGNIIIVWNDMLSKPVAVRFAWKNFPCPNLYNKDGLPASPFRTDEWQEIFDKKYPSGFNNVVEMGIRWSTQSRLGN